MERLSIRIVPGRRERLKLVFSVSIFYGWSTVAETECGQRADGGRKAAYTDRRVGLSPVVRQASCVIAVVRVSTCVARVSRYRVYDSLPYTLHIHFIQLLRDQTSWQAVEHEQVEQA